jgi:hypothetical protein
MLWTRLLCRLSALLLFLMLAPTSSFAQAGWVDVAGAVWRGGDGSAYVAVGFSGTQPTPDGATAAALQACQSAGGVGCQNYGPVRGCAYIVVGSYPNGVAYGVGGSPNDAIAEARSAGATSWHAPIGGCGY